VIEINIEMRTKPKPNPKQTPWRILEGSGVVGGATKMVAERMSVARAQNHSES
jgi:hypothetical protein